MSSRTAPMTGGGQVASVLRGFRVQGRVVHALVLREVQTRFGRQHLGFLWLFIEPLLLASAIATFKWAAEYNTAYAGISVFVFALVSYLPYFCFRAIVGRAPGALHQNMTLLYHARIKLIDVVIARHVLEALSVLAVMTLITIGVVLWGDVVPANIPLLFLGLLLLFLYAHGLGLMAAAAAAAWPMTERLIHPLVYLSLPLSGALVALHAVDPALRDVLLWNPQAHIHEMIRDSFFGPALPSHYSIAYVCFWVGLFNLLGLAALRAVRPSLEL